MSPAAADSVVAAPTAGAPLTDDGLLELIIFGMLVGTPLLFVVAVLIASVSGVGLANALAIGIIPALFGGVTLGGFGALMRHLRQEDMAEAAARSAHAGRAALAS